MVWWQYLLIVLGSALIGYWLSRIGARAERDTIEQRQLQSAVKGLLTEIDANLKLIEKGPDMALYPPLAKDMWNTHKSRIVELPTEIQACLYEAYVRLDYVNAVLDTRVVEGSRGHGPGAWETRWKNEGEKATNPMEEARHCLEVWLKEQKPGEENKPADSLMRKYVVSQAPTYLFASFLFIQRAGLSQEVGATYWLYISLGFALLTWAFILCVDAWREQRVFRKVAQVMEVPYWIITVIVFGGALVTNLVAVLNADMGNLYYYIFFSAGIALLILLTIHFVQSTRQKGAGYMTLDRNNESIAESQPSIVEADLSQFEVQYFIQTRKEIDTEKQERNKLLHYALIAAGASAIGLAQIERSTDFLLSPWALALYLPLLLLISGIVAARRMKLQQIFDRWITLYSILQARKLAKQWTPVEETVIHGFRSRRYLYEDFALHLGLSVMVYGLMIATMIRLISDQQSLWPLLVTAPVLLHSVFTTLWLLRRFRFSDRVSQVLSRHLKQ